MQVGTHTLAGSPFSTFDSRPSTDFGGKKGGRAVVASPEAPAEPVPHSLFPALSGSPEALATPQLDAEDSVLIAQAEQREVFSERPFKLDDLVL